MRFMARSLRGRSRRAVLGLSQVCRKGLGAPPRRLRLPAEPRYCGDGKHRVTILLVEDELELGRLVVRELEAAGYAVEHAHDGAEALRRFAARTAELVILDWML